MWAGPLTIRMKQQATNRGGETPPLHLAVHLVSSSVMLGEPVVLCYRLTNTSRETLSVHVGRDKKDWMTMRLGGPSKTPPRSRPDLRLRQGGIYSTGIRISAESSATGSVVVSQRFLVSEAGDYDLSLDVVAPYEADFQAGKAPPRSEEPPAERTVLTESHAFPLTVTEAQPARLRAIAEALREAAAQAGSQERMMSLEALFSMPEEYASESWRAAAFDPRLLHSLSFIADQLERLSTIAAAGILVEMVLNTPPAIVGKVPADGATTAEKLPITLSFSVHRQFHNLYFHADPALKAHLTKMYNDRGWAVPDRPIIIID